MGETPPFLQLTHSLLHHLSTKADQAHQHFVLSLGTPMMARYFRLSRVAVFAFVLGMAREGHAEWQYQLSAASSTGVAQNPSLGSSGTSTSVDYFETVRGRALLINMGRFAQSRLAYAVGATKWLRGTRGFSISHTLSLGSTIEAHPTLSIGLSGSATLTQISMLDAYATTDPQALGPRPSGNEELLTVQAGETVTWRPSPSWSFSESLDGQFYRPINDDSNTGSNKRLTLGVQASHLWTRDTAGLRGRMGQVWRESAVDTAQTPTGQTTSQFADVGLAWTHEWSQEWNHDVSAGISVVRAYDRTNAAPSASAGVLWRRLGTSAALRVGQSADANIYVGTAYNRRFVSLNVQTPIDRWETLRATAGGNIEHVWTSSTSDGSEASANAYSARAGLYWQPSPMVSLSLDYSFRDQRPSATGSTPSLFPAVRRQTAMFTIEVRYPPQL
jgi:hypothetical protein